MSKTRDHLETLSEIRTMMERSSRFISLSGLSGVLAGAFALTGAGAAWWKMSSTGTSAPGYPEQELSGYAFYLADAAIVLIASVAAGSLLTMRRARKKNQTIWDPAARRLLINLLIPLSTGGVFCIALLMQNMAALIAPSMLIFYGLSLINASKYTLDDIRQLGICEVLLGSAACFFTGYGLLFWSLGFGVLHIVYGIALFNKYERQA